MAKFETTTCGCGIEFAVPDHFLSARRHDKESFYCPNGHSLSYKQSEADRMRLERDRLKQQLAMKDDDIASERRRAEFAEERQRAAERKTKRITKRIHAGVCPCCNRSFQNVARHMATKHPGQNVSVLKSA